MGWYSSTVRGSKEEILLKTLHFAMDHFQLMDHDAGANQKRNLHSFESVTTRTDPIGDRPLPPLVGTKTFYTGIEKGEKGDGIATRDQIKFEKTRKLFASIRYTCFVWGSRSGPRNEFVRPSSMTWFHCERRYAK